MAWVTLPPRLRDRVPRVTLLEAIPATIGTVGFGLVLLAGPAVLTYVLASRGQTVLAVLMGLFAAWWLYRMVREPLIPGLLLAAPASVWSVVQQQRGKVDTLDLERGRLVGLTDWRPLTAAEREVLHALVRQVDDLPEHARQIDECEVIAECVCGCASIRLLSRGPMAPRDASRGNAEGERDHLAIAGVGSDPAGHEVDVVLHTGLGTLRELEVTIGGVHDGSATELPAARTLRPAGVRHERWDP